MTPHLWQALTLPLPDNGLPDRARMVAVYMLTIDARHYDNQLFMPGITSGSFADHLMTRAELGALRDPDGEPWFHVDRGVIRVCGKLLRTLPKVRALNTARCWAKGLHDAPEMISRHHTKMLVAHAIEAIELMDTPDLVVFWTDVIEAIEHGRDLPRFIKPPARLSANVSPRLRVEILQRDGYRCVYCGATPSIHELVVDHIVPIKDGGTRDLRNLVTACIPCNAGKSDRRLRVLPGGLKGRT
jgi:hypothetical protein